MPVYTYRCEDDHRNDEIFLCRQKRPKKLKCRVCGKPTTRHYEPPQLITMEPYWTDAGDGKKRQIRTPEQERAYERRFGLAHLMDSDLKKMQDRCRNGGQAERWHRSFSAELPDMYEQYQQAEAELSEVGVEYLKEQEGAAREAAEMLQADIDADMANC